MIDTSTVTGRRELRFADVPAMLADARACVADGPRLRRLGNWSIGQALNHLAAWIDYPYLGYPAALVLPESFKTQARASLPRLMQETMRPGENLPGIVGGTLATEETPADVGLARLEAAATRLQAQDPVHDDPAFGPVTRHQWTEINLRHCELHLSFFVP